MWNYGVRCNTDVFANHQYQTSPSKAGETAMLVPALSCKSLSTSDKVYSY